jgi:hypothetical protein
MRKDWPQLCFATREEADGGKDNHRRFGFWVQKCRSCARVVIGLCPSEFLVVASHLKEAFNAALELSTHALTHHTKYKIMNWDSNEKSRPTQ